MQVQTQNSYDVLILGAGIAGSVLGAILARQGASVLLVDAGCHPRFAVGESTIPHTSLLLALLAERYGVPELENLTYPDRLAQTICTTCGIKRAFGFAYHRPGQTYDPREGFQLGTNLKDENQLFRQDIDAYVFNVAVRYGAQFRLNTRVTGVEIGRQGVRLQLDPGEPVQGRYVVDATGFRSVLAQAFDLREKPTRFKHHSRSLFTHCIDVGLFEAGTNPLSLPWELTTLHHVFERGWIWVIPFNNHPRSTNPLVSIGLTFDPRLYPKTGETPEQEFCRFVQRFPGLAGQFARARAVRPWVSTERLQYSSRRTVGYRYCLMSHAAGALDPLYSRGLINTFEVIYALLEPLLQALASGDFAEEAFAPVERLQQRVLDYNDRLVNCSFISWCDFELWNAWVRVWAFGTFLAEFRLMKALHDYTVTRDLACLKGEVEQPLFSDYEDPDYAAFFDQAASLVEAFEAGGLPGPEAAARIFSLMGDYAFLLPIHRDAMRRAGWLTGDQDISDRNLDALRRGYRWALAHPKSRDLFGNTSTFYRWRSRQPDPHLA